MPADFYFSISKKRCMIVQGVNARAASRRAARALLPRARQPSAPMARARWRASAAPLGVSNGQGSGTWQAVARPQVYSATFSAYGRKLGKLTAGPVQRESAADFERAASDGHAALRHAAARLELGVCVTLSRRPWTLSRRRAGVWCQRSDLEKSPANAHHRAPRAAGACIAPPLCHKAGRQLLRTRLVRPGARRHATRCVDAEDGRARQAVRGERVRLVGRLEAGEAARCIHHLRTLSPGTVILATF